MGKDFIEEAYNLQKTGGRKYPVTVMRCSVINRTWHHFLGE